MENKRTYTSDEVWEMMYDADFRDVADWGNTILKIDHPDADGKIEFDATRYGERLFIVENGMSTGFETNRLDKWRELVSDYFSAFEPENEVWTEQDFTDFTYAILTAFLRIIMGLDSVWDIEPKVCVNENIILM